MVEVILAWVMLIVGVFTRDSRLFIASGAFAIAAQLFLIRQGCKNGS